MEVREQDQLLINEMRRIDGAIKKRQKVIESLASAQGKKIFNRRYVIDLPVAIIGDPGSPSISLEPVYRSFVVDRDCVYFFCKELVYTVAATASIFQPFGAPTAGKVSLPNTLVGVWFNWEVRDTYTDRSWQNLPLPCFAMGSGKTSGFPLSRPAALPAGTEVQFTLAPFSDFLQGSGLIDAVSAFSVQVSFSGFEVV